MTLRLKFAPNTAGAGAGILALALLAACNGEDEASAVKAPKYAADITRTSYGIAHIKATDEGGLGFGIAYAYAQDNICQFANEIVTVNGDRSRYFDPAADRGDSPVPVPNLQSDFFYRLINDADAVSVAWQQQPAPMRALVEGYVAGYNHYLEQTGAAKLPAACKNAPWVRKLTETDMIKMLRRYAAEGGALHFSGALVGATPPSAAAAPAVATPTSPEVLTAAYWKKFRSSTGSNAVALGKDATDNGQGMLLGNPHFPWRGALRFYQLHLTIPGKLDAMGASIGGMPMVNIGFNQDLAWSHTVNTSLHFTFHMLQLDPADPTRYMVDGKSQSMTKKTISVDVKGADGVVRPMSRDLYSTQFGNLAVIPGLLNWDKNVAFVMRDANLENHRMLEQWDVMGRARSLTEFKGAVERIVGLPWVNTLAADKEGNTLYMDVTVVPNVSSAKQAACIAPPLQPLRAQGIFVLSGATAACAWDKDPAAPQPGIFAGARLPSLTRSDFVQNSNDSAWLSNPAAPLTGFADIVSTSGSEQRGRTRIGISQLQARLAGTDGMAGKRMTMAQLQSLVLNNRVYAAQLIMDDVLTVCGGNKIAAAEDGSSIDLSQACANLAVWDRTANLDANTGHVYFTGLWDRIVGVPGVWAVPFNPADPVNTPRGLNLADAGILATVRGALASSVRDASAAGIAPNALWGDIQFAMRGERKIPMHGGADEYGIYNAIFSIAAGPGIRDVLYGTSYIQTVRFDSNGPQAQAFLSYSQASDPASPYYFDQTERFAQKAWITQAFTEAQIKADPAYTTIRITQKP